MRYRLEDIFDLQMGKTPSRNNLDYWNTKDHKWISIGDLSKCERYISDTKEYISDKAVAESGISEIPANTVIMSFKLSIGKVAITPEPMYSNEAIMSFRDKHVVEIIPSYIYYMFLNKNWEFGTNKAVMGKTLNKSTLSKVAVDICDIGKQYEIVRVLDKAASIISKRKLELGKLDEMVNARFIEMFGDPSVNPKGWPLRKLGNLGELNRGVSKHRPRNAPELLGGIYPLIQTGDVANSATYISGYTSTYSELGLKQSRMWPKGTLCITIAANIAKTGILDFDACFPDSVVGFIPDKIVDTLYIHYWFSFFQKILEEQAPQSAQKNINLKILRDLNVMVPPYGLQEQFINFVYQVNKSKVAIKRGMYYEHLK